MTVFVVGEPYPQFVSVTNGGAAEAPSQFADVGVPVPGQVWQVLQSWVAGLAV